jgi:hypothetical protein
MSNCVNITPEDFKWAYMTCGMHPMAFRYEPISKHKHQKDGRCYTSFKFELSSKTSSGLQIVQMKNDVNTLHMRLYGWNKETIVGTFTVPTVDLHFGLIKAIKMFLKWEAQFNVMNYDSDSDSDSDSRKKSKITKDMPKKPDIQIIRFECDIPGGCAAAYTNVLHMQLYLCECIPIGNMQVYIEPNKFVIVKITKFLCSRKEYDSRKLKLVKEMKSMKELHTATQIEMICWQC